MLKSFFEFVVFHLPFNFFGLPKGTAVNVYSIILVLSFLTAICFLCDLLLNSVFGFTKKLQNPETGTVDLLNHSFGIDDFQTVSEIAAFVACFVFLFIVYLPFTTAFDTAIDDAVESDSFTLVYDSNSIVEGSGSLPHFEYNAEWGRWLLAGNCSIDYGVKVSANGKEISVNGLQQKYQNLGSRDYSVPLISLEDGTEITVKYYDKAVEYSKPLLLVLFSVMVCIFVMFFKLLSDYKVRDTDSRVGTE